VIFFKNSNMRRLLWILVLFLILLNGCSQGERIVDETWPDGTPKRTYLVMGEGDERVILEETLYYPDGQIKASGEMQNGKRHGHWIYYHKNGKTWSEGYFKNGENDGKRLTYFDDGTLQYEAWYDNGQRVGTWKFYNKEGELIKEVPYTDSH
jgi:antitoxin component YwqK of YwqJK toxin-antitoxin module